MGRLLKGLFVSWKFVPTLKPTLTNGLLGAQGAGGMRVGTPWARRIFPAVSPLLVNRNVPGN